MTKEEILEKSRRERHTGEEYEAQVINRSGRIASSVGLLLCCAVSVLQLIFTGRLNFGAWIIFFGMLSSLFFVKFFKIRRKHELLVACLYTFLGIIFAVTYIVNLVIVP